MPKSYDSLMLSAAKLQHEAQHAAADDNLVFARRLNTAAENLMREARALGPSTGAKPTVH